MLTATESQVDHSFCSKQRGQVRVQAADSCSHCESEPSETAPEHGWGKEGPRTARGGYNKYSISDDLPWMACILTAVKWEWGYINSKSSQLSYIVLLTQSANGTYKEGRNVIKSKFASAYSEVHLHRRHTVFGYSWAHSVAEYERLKGTERAVT